MFEKVFLASLGALTLTKEKSREWVDQLVKKGEIAREEAPEFLRQLAKRGEEVSSELDKRISSAVDSFSRSMDFATKSDLDELRKEIRDLASKLEAPPKKRKKK